MTYTPNLVNKLSIESYDPAADEVKDLTIGGDPIDAVILTISVDAVTDLPTLTQYLEVLNSVKILHNGNPIKEFSTTADMLVMAALRQKYVNRVMNHENTDPSNAFLQIPLLFGRHLYDPDFAFPSVDDQDLTLSLDVDVADTDVDNPQINVDVLYKKNFASKGYVKETTKTITGTATGDFDVVVPREGKLLGILLFSTTVPVDSADTTTLNWVRYLEDNSNVWYNQVYWESLQSMLQYRIGNQSMFYGHFSRENLAAMYTQNADTDPAENDVDPIRQYGYLDFDPLDDLSLWRDLTKVKEVGLKVNYGDTSAARMVPVVVLPP